MYQPFKLKLIPIVGILKPKTMLVQLLNNFQKVHKTSFCALNIVKMTLLDGQNLTLNFDFRAHLSTFRGKNTPKVGLLRPKTMPTQIQNNFQKVK